MFLVILINMYVVIHIFIYMYDVVDGNGSSRGQRANENV